MRTRTSYRIAVIGGSIAGCGAAIAAARAGHDVVVYERSGAELAERGLGIGISPALRDELVAAGYLDDDMPACAAAERVWITRAAGAGGDDGSGRELWRQASGVLTCNWGMLWRGLRRHVPDAVYRRGDPVAEVAEVAEIPGVAAGALVRTESGREEPCDLVVGADGERSLVRAAVAPGAVPHHAGYGIWRASAPLSALPEGTRIRRDLTGRYYTIVFPRGHAVLYLIPGEAGAELRLNWVIYAWPPEGTPLGPGRSYPPGQVTEALAAHARELAERHFPARWRDAVLATDPSAMAVHPVHDLPLPRVARAPFLLAGDAGTITRPHTASGAGKALQDALQLERALREAPSPADAVAAYDAQRTEQGNQLVSIGRALGRAQVEDTPDWNAMDAAGMAAWAEAMLNGRPHYLYGER
jgi:2-polyprenyl-6-methoxyphenol hydroxylase-like FAD-dependent oxidoreductase